MEGKLTGRRWLRPMDGFLDDTYFHRVGWHYSAQYHAAANASGAPNAGKIVVFDDRRCYGVQWEGDFANRYPNHLIGQGSIIVADDVKTQGKSKGFNMVDRGGEPVWKTNVPLVVRAMVLAPTVGGDDKQLLIAGPLERDDDPLAPYQGRGDGRLYVLSAENGEKAAELGLPAQPVFDGMVAANGRVFLSLTDGTLLSLTGKD
jgi:outer membrane protein assembly factor BamB